jgi:ATP-dependent Lon protease
MTPNDNNPRRPKTRSITAQEENDLSNSDTPTEISTNKAKYYRKLEPVNKDDEKTTKPITKKMKMTTKPKIDTQKMFFNIILDEIMKKNKNKIEDDTDDDYNDNTEKDDDDDDNSLCGKPVLDGLKKDILYGYDEVVWIKKLDENQKTEIVSLENKILETTIYDTPLRFRVLKSPNLNDKSKQVILHQLEQGTNSISEEHYKIKKWISMMDKIPFDTFIQPKFKENSYNNTDVCDYLKSIKSIMDEEVYGHDIAKSQIISILAREISNPKSMGNVFAIQGPMGNGKTTLVKHGICKAMNRPFGFVPLGGMQESSYLIGHETTYIGSKPGRIVEILMETNCMNPIFYFDELDKVSDTSKGEEIMNVLCHLTDTTQNHAFQDKYFSGIDFNLSRATFIFSYNDESKISPILLDRMNKIKTDGFDAKSKITIAKQYLLPKLLNEYNFNKDDIIITDEVIQNIINNFIDKEHGVRNLKRCLDEIISKCNILRYDPTGELINFKLKKFSLPIEINNDNFDYFIKKKELSGADAILYSMYL